MSDQYEKADISGNLTKIKGSLSKFISANNGSNVDEFRINLPRIKKMIQQAVDYVEGDESCTVRVDGYSIRPILIELVNKNLDELPPIEVEEA